MTTDDYEKMDKSIDKLIGKVPYDAEDQQEVKVCDHEDDGFTYGGTITKITLRCSKCGEYYEIKK